MGLYFLILLLFAIAITMIAKRTGLLRDVISDISKFNENAKEEKIKKPKAPYSLGRTQLTFWMIIIIGSYLYLYIKKGYVTPELYEVNVILLGISIGTTVVGKVIEETQSNAVRHQDSPSQGFLTDILSDEKGLSIHRLQNVLWNLVVAVIYIRTVSISSSLPDYSIISEQLLALMGISSGAYVGMKATENMKATPPQPAGKEVAGKEVEEAAPEADAIFDAPVQAQG
jgi:hypothetical protein